METALAIVSCAGAFAWIALCLVPWRPWSTRESLDVAGSGDNLEDVTVVIPARNEADTIAVTLRALSSQGSGLRVVLVDDQSTDGTTEVARVFFPSDRLTIVRGVSLPEGWTGKLWALEQGRWQVSSQFVLLLDADIQVEPGVVGALKGKLMGEKLDLVSVMAALRMQSFWEKLLMPAFIYFFKLLYPFSLGNRRDTKVAVAAGGCILIRAGVLEKIGGFACIRDNLIDDCALARKVKDAGGATWMGLSHNVASHRPYDSLWNIWEMVARTAFTQLRYSNFLLFLTTCVMVVVFLGPFAGIIVGPSWLKAVALIGLTAMIATYLPTLKYYGRSPFWGLGLPIIGALFLAMTWSSAVRCWAGRRSAWKGRVYAKAA